jgi:hypothetical protein
MVNYGPYIYLGSFICESCISISQGIVMSNTIAFPSMILENRLIVRKDMDVNEHERLYNNTNRVDTN